MHCALGDAYFPQCRRRILVGVLTLQDVVTLQSMTQCVCVCVCVCGGGGHTYHQLYDFCWNEIDFCWNEIDFCYLFCLPLEGKNYVVKDNRTKTEYYEIKQGKL